MIDLITGHQGVPHISAEQVATINNVMMYGYGQDAVVRLKDGTISMDGLEILFNEGYWRANGYDIQITENDSVILDPTSAGMSRIDVVYAEVLQDIPSGVQRVELVVVQGTETVNPIEPPAPEAPQLTTDLLIQAVPIVKCTVSGSGMTIEDQTLPLSSGAEKAIDSMVNLLGSKNLIPYPYADTSKTIGGITFVDNGDGTVTVSGTATETAYFTVLNPNPEERTNPALKIPTNGEDFILTGCPSGAYAEDIYYQLQIQEYTENSGMIGYTDYGEGVKVTPHNDPMLVRAIFITVFQGTVISEPITFKPMLRPASIIDDTWVPYSKTNRQITTDFEMVSQKDDAYSVIKAYHVGDLVTQDGAIYKCITNCSAASWEVNKTNFEKTSLTEIANELNSALLKLLWSNPNPSSTTFSSQDIVLSSDDYNFLRVFFLAEGAIKSVDAVNLKNIYLDCARPNTAGAGTASRILTYVSKTKFHAEDSIYSYGTQSRIVNNGMCIPLWIYGYKR